MVEVSKSETNHAKARLWTQATRQSLTDPFKLPRYHGHQAAFARKTCVISHAMCESDHQRNQSHQGPSFSRTDFDPNPLDGLHSSGLVTRCDGIRKICTHEGCDGRFTLTSFLSRPLALNVGFVFCALTPTAGNMNQDHPNLDDYCIDDSWAVAESSVRNLPMIVRIRPNLSDLIGHPQLSQRLRVIWKYESDSEFGLPPTEEMEAMDVCENALVASLESDNHTIMSHILTGDSMRQWIFYSSDLEEAVTRVRDVMESGIAAPIEATAMEDPS
jgi:hypothetical protein